MASMPPSPGAAAAEPVADPPRHASSVMNSGSVAISSEAAPDGTRVSAHARTA
jgi:hypothetical protein